MLCSKSFGSSWMTLVVIAMTLSLLGCIGEKPAKCESKETIKAVREIIAGKLLKGETFCSFHGCKTLKDDKDVASLAAYLDFEFPRALSYDEQVKKYSCTAEVALDGKALFDGAFVYESQLTADENIVFVNATTINQDPVVVFLQSLPAKRRSMEETTRRALESATGGRVTRTEK